MVVSICFTTQWVFSTVFRTRKALPKDPRPTRRRSLWAWLACHSPQHSPPLRSGGACILQISSTPVLLTSPGEAGAAVSQLARTNLRGAEPPELWRALSAPVPRLTPWIAAAPHETRNCLRESSPIIVLRETTVSESASQVRGLALLRARFVPLLSFCAARSRLACRAIDRPCR